MNDPHPFTAPTAAQPRKRQRGVRWWLVLAIFGVPVLVLTLGTLFVRIGYTLRESSGRQAMTEELQKLADEGQPIGNESIDNLYRSRTSPDDTEAWLKLFNTVESAEFKKSYAAVPLLDRAVDNESPFRFAAAEDWEYASVCANFATKSQALIQKVRILAAAPVPVRFPIYFESMETLLPEVQSLRSVALVVFVDSQVAIHLRDGQRATQDILALYGLAHQVDAVPGIISHLVGIAIRRLALQAVQGCIEIDLLQDDQLHQVDKIMQDYCEIGDSWRTAISEDLALCLPAFTNPATALQSNTPMPARGHDAVYFIGLMRQAMQLDTRDWSEFSNAAKNLDVKVDGSLGSFLQSIDRVLSHVLAPAFGAMATTWIGDAQLHRQARVAIAIRGHAHRFGELPNNLDDLPDAIARLHPMGNKPFGYERQEDQAVLWGFDVTGDVRRTPISPPAIEAGVAGGMDSYRFVWHIKREAN